MAIAPKDVRVLDDEGHRLDITSGGALDVSAATVTVTDDGAMTVSADISQSDDSVQIYGNDGTNNQAILTDSNGALDVSASTVTVTDDGSFTASVDVTESDDSIQVYGFDGTNNQAIATDSSGALDVSGATVTVTDDGSFTNDATITDVSTGGTQSNNLLVDINAQSGSALDVSGATVTVTDDGSFNATVSQSSFGNLKADSDLYVNGSQVTESNPVPVEWEVSGTDTASQKTSSSVSPGTTNQLTFQPSASVTATVQSMTASAEVPFRAEIIKYDGTAETTMVQVHGDGNTTEVWKPEAPDASLFEQSIDSSQTEEFRVTTENKEPSAGQNGDIHITLEWTEE